MNRPGTFRAGADGRRNTSAGRPPSAKTIAAIIRRTLGPDVQQICDQVRILVAAGDPAAVTAAASLLAAVSHTVMPLVERRGDATGVAAPPFPAER